MVTFQCWVLDVAKKCGVKVRIAHSHNLLTNDAKLTTRLIHRCCRPKLNRVATDRFACGEEAGNSLYGRKREFIIIKNGVDIDLFQTNEAQRLKVRNELGIDEKTIIVGSVGRLDTQKNYEFLLDVFAELLEICPNYRLLLVGTGEQEKALKYKSEQLHIDKSVVFYGASDNVPAMMNAMDVFVLPSIFEGLVLVLVEAQAVGLPCIASDRVPQEVNISNTIKFLPLEADKKEWVNNIIKLSSKGKYNNIKLIKKAGYSINDAAEELKKWYISQINNVSYGE